VDEREEVTTNATGFGRDDALHRIRSDCCIDRVAAEVVDVHRSTCRQVVR
jgi:hypothetical protein